MKHKKIILIFSWILIVCIILGFILLKDLIPKQKKNISVYSVANNSSVNSKQQEENSNNNLSIDGENKNEVNLQTNLQEQSKNKEHNWLNENNIDETTVSQKSKLTPKIAKIKVQIAGEVENGGVYEMNSGERVVDVINKAGGFTKEADETSVNLAKILADEEQIVVGNINDIEKYGEKAENAINTAKENKKININTATLEEIETLPKIGPVTAQKIIDYRTSNGGFKSIEEIKNVKGIGDKTFEGFKEILTVK